MSEENTNTESFEDHYINTGIDDDWATKLKTIMVTLELENKEALITQEFILVDGKAGTGGNFHIKRDNIEIIYPIREFRGKWQIPIEYRSGSESKFSTISFETERRAKEVHLTLLFNEV